jgi:uncharacterized membrane protein
VAYSDQQLEISIGKMLRFGVVLSAAVVFVGGVLYLRSPNSPAPSYVHFVAEDATLRSISGVLPGLARFDAASVIQLGLLLLIATPIARVAFCIVGFGRQRDIMYFAISALVLAILIYSLVQGR